jgi:hypothetical protein
MMAMSVQKNRVRPVCNRTVNFPPLRVRGNRYDTCVIDYLWYQTSTTGEWLLDDYCRPQPDPERWPSSRNGTGFRAVAAKVHAMGLKFGIHIMRGTSTFAASQNCLIKGAQPEARIRDVAAAPCSWSTYSLSVNVSKSAGVQFYRSILEQYVPLRHYLCCCYTRPCFS